MFTMCISLYSRNSKSMLESNGKHDLRWKSIALVHLFRNVSDGYIVTFTKTQIYIN